MLSLTLLSAMLVSSSWAIDFTPCDDGDQTISSIDIDACSDPSETCMLTLGEEVGIVVKFQLAKDADVLYAETGTNVYGLDFPNRLTPPNACDGDVQCPAMAGQSYTYSGKYVPSLGSTKRDNDGYFTLRDSINVTKDASNEVACAEFTFRMAEAA